MTEIRVRGPVAKAIAETDSMVAGVRSQVKERKLWSYVRSDVLLDLAKEHENGTMRELAAKIGGNVVSELNEMNPDAMQLARLFFERPENTVVRGHIADGKVMFAVWMGSE